MPTYEYQCKGCGKHFSLFLSYSEYDTAVISCPACGSAEARRIIRPVRVTVGEKTRLQNLSQEIRGDNSSRMLGKVMRTVQQQSGKQLEGPYEEVLTRLEKGEKPADIDKDYED